MDFQQTSIKQSAIGWVKKSIDENLNEIRVELDYYLEDFDISQLESVQERLEVIKGVLTLVEQYGASILAEEIASLCQFILKSENNRDEQALEVLMRSVLQFPDFLEHIQAGHQDTPIAILPLLNDIRAVKNEDLFSEKLLFLPDINLLDNSSSDSLPGKADNENSITLARQLRPAYLFALLGVIRDKDFESSIVRLAKISEAFAERSVADLTSRFWWIVGALVESIQSKQMELGVSIKLLLARVDAVLKVMLTEGEQGVLDNQPAELMRNLLYYIAQPVCDGPKAQAIKHAYQLDQFIHTGSESSNAQNDIAGPNKALLQSVAQAVNTDLEGIKLSLSSFVENGLNDKELLQDLPKDLHVISDTLAMIGLGAQRQIIESQIKQIGDIISGETEAEENNLLTMAAELLQVEQALNLMQKRIFELETESTDTIDVSEKYELDSVLTAAVSAGIDDIQSIKNAILDFIKHPGKNENINLCVNLLKELKGALLLLEQENAVEAIDGLIKYLTEHDEIEFLRRENLESLSEVIASIEYYLEALGEKRDDANKILLRADSELEKLNSIKADQSGAEFERISPEDVAIHDNHLQSDDGLSSENSADHPVTKDVVDELSGELEDLHFVLEKEETANESKIEIVPVEDDLIVLKSGSDSEILDIYIEEAEEEAENILQQQQDWLLHIEDENAIKNIRRSFHTIKGSGRLVGAMAIGEFAWDFENLLNRVIDKSIKAGIEIIEAVGEASEVLKELVEQLKNGTEPTSDIPYLRGLARALAEFKVEDIINYRRRDERTVEPTEASISNEDIESVDANDFTEINLNIDDSAVEKIELAEEEISIDLIEQVAEDSVVNITEEPIVEVVEEEVVIVEQAADELELNAANNIEESGLDEVPLPDPFEPKTITETTLEDQITLVENVETDVVEDSIPEIEVDSEHDVAEELDIDPELMRIFQQEVEQHLLTLKDCLNRAESLHELVLEEDTYRALHTIHGASRTAGISTIARLAKLLEHPVKLALSHSVALDEESLALFHEGHDALKQMTTELVENYRTPALPEDLKIRLQKLADEFSNHTVELPEDHTQATNEFVDTLSMMTESVSSEQDDELIGIFIEEARELLEMSDHTLHEWENKDVQDEDSSSVMELQRYLHTLKGGAKMAEISPIANLSHELESLFIAVMDKRVDKNEELISHLKNSFDLLHKQIQQTSVNETLEQSEQQIAILQKIRKGTVEETDSIQLAQAEETSTETPEIIVEQLPKTFERQTQDVIKVRSDLLDNLVNSAGEVSIYRARMEQQVSGFGSHLGELDRTITRLKNQLRNLEAETDAQIFYSHKDKLAEQDFDPLEMDRYTLIQELSKSLSESVNDLSSLQSLLGDQVRDSETLLLQQSRVSTDLQDGLIRSRMVKFSGLLSRLRRLVRQTSKELGKKVKLEIAGEEHEIDNKVLDRMVAPIEHIIRNAIFHGIESPVQRLAKGKPETGLISIDIHRNGSDVVVKIKDDGAGINIEKAKSRAMQLGLMDAKQQLSDADVVQFILEPGFSTADKVTQVSGRGVGMDVVDSEIKQLSGSLAIDTDSNGTSFIATLPFTLSINQAILVRSGEMIFAIPLVNIEGITRIDTDELVELYKQEDSTLDYAGQVYNLFYLTKLLDRDTYFKTDTGDLKRPVILLRSADMRVALHLDEIIGNREIVVKSLGKQLSQVKGLSGASILADGSVVMILDISGLIRHSDLTPVKTVSSKGAASLQSSGREKPLIMVVDDSITMRRVASKLLERHYYQTVTAKDGVDALVELEKEIPDLMLLDIEMPRMDGFELSSRMKSDPRFSDIPIIMITSRTGEKHQHRALEIGITRYMGKPYQEAELIDNIKQALAENV